MIRKYKQGKCVDCVEAGVYVDKLLFTKKLCAYHYRKRVNERARERAKNKPKKPVKPLKRTPIKKGAVTGEGELFNEIAKERERVCFVTGEYIRELLPWNFVHVLAKRKSAFPLFLLYKKNIQICHKWVHDEWDYGDSFDPDRQKELIAIHPGFQKLIDLQAELFDEYQDYLKSLKIGHSGRTGNILKRD